MTCKLIGRSSLEKPQQILIPGSPAMLEGSSSASETSPNKTLLANDIANRIKIRLQCQAREVGLTGLATRRVGQDGINAHQVDRHGSQDMLHLHLGEAIIA